MVVEIREMTIDDYAAAAVLWAAVEGVGLSQADSPAGIAQYLRRNPGLSFVAHDNGQLVGAVLCGHDGRRGYLHHLAVAESHRGRGIGRTLVYRCLDALRSIGIAKCHLFVFATNYAAIGFWESSGWERRNDLVVMSRYTAD
jgi:ribosomal protein S18 acetylase RimI-like enzyme